MAIERAMALTNRLLSHAQSLAAVTAYVPLAGPMTKLNITTGFGVWRQRLNTVIRASSDDITERSGFFCARRMLPVRTSMPN